MADERISPVEEIRILRAMACDRQLSRGDVGVGAVILRHCNGGRHAFPGPTRIAAEAQLSVTNVKISLRKLESLKYIQVIRPGRRIANRFVVLDPPAPRSRHAGEPRELNLEKAKREVELIVSSLANEPSGAALARDASNAATGDVDGLKLGMLARQEVAFESPFEITSAARDLEGQEAEQQQQLEQKILASERERAQSLESMRAEYVEACGRHPLHAKRMEKLFPSQLSDLIAAYPRREPVCA